MALDFLNITTFYPIADRWVLLPAWTAILLLLFCSMHSPKTYQWLPV